MYGFDDLLEGLTNAIQKGQALSQGQHIRMLERFFVKGEDGQLTARSIKLTVPDLDGDGKPEMTVDVPLLTLVPMNSLMLDEVHVEFEAFLSMLGNKHVKTIKQGKEVHEKQKNVQMELPGSGQFGRKKNNVKVKISLKVSDPPEGLVRINDRILKSIP